MNSMLNVILVDDESIIRYGLKHSIDWMKYGMNVVGEASDVKSAKELISLNNTVDIVFTDIAMPVENGIELVRWAKENHPLISVVVLTYHSDFLYIQESLRFGAIDYIVKTELDSSDINKTLSRIAQIASANKKNNNTNAASPVSDDYTQALMLVSTEYINLEWLGFPDSCILQINDSTTLLLCSTNCSEEMLANMEDICSGKAMILLIKNCKGRQISEIITCSKLFMEQDLFYRFIPNIYLYEINMDILSSAVIDKRKFQWIEEQLKSLLWLNDDKLFHEILLEIQQNRLMPSMVLNLFMYVQMEWQHICQSENDIFDYYRISSFKYWYQWLDWIKNFRAILVSSSGMSELSEEIVRSIQKLVVWLNRNLSSEIDIKQAAGMVNLSVSYFNKCFKKIIGKSFNTYLNDLRIDYAKKLLTQTKCQIYRISELGGFSNQFYFAKVFKSCTGFTPSAYRLKYQKEI